MDVCCVGAAMREEPIVPKPLENRTTYEAGCGVRNVDGLDFQLAGAFVCDQILLIKIKLNIWIHNFLYPSFLRIMKLVLANSHGSVSFHTLG